MINTVSNQSYYTYFGITNYYYNLKLTYTIVLFLYHAGRTNTIALFCCFTRFWYLLSLSTQMWCRRKYTRQGKNIIIHCIFLYFLCNFLQNNYWYLSKIFVVHMSTYLLLFFIFFSMEKPPNSMYMPLVKLI